MSGDVNSSKAHRGLAVGGAEYRHVVVVVPKGSGRLARMIERVKATPGAVLACPNEEAATTARERYGLAAEQVTWPRRDLLGVNPRDVFDWYRDPWSGLAR